MIFGFVFAVLGISILRRSKTKLRMSRERDQKSGQMIYGVREAAAAAATVRACRRKIRKLNNFFYFVLIKFCAFFK